MKKKYILIIIFLISIIISSIFIENFNSSEIVVYDENKPTYNIGDLMLMSTHHGPWREKYKENKDQFIIEYIDNNKKYYDSFPNSIFANYIKLLEEKSKIDLKSIELPNIELIQRATDQYYHENKNKINDFFNKINNEKTLFVHVRSGDKGHISDDFINTIHSLENEYEKIILLCGIHNETTYSSKDDSKKNLTDDINKIIGENNQKYVANIDEPDVHLCYFRKCENLLLSHGGFTCLGAILFNGDKLYATKQFNCMDEKTNNITWI
jgi:hypothetical protein